MASIQKYETKKGIRWMYVIENGIDPKTGKRQRIPKRGFLREKDAKQAAAEMEYILGKVKLDMKNKITFKELCDEWHSVYKLSGVKNSTLRTRRKEIRYLNKHLGHKKVKDISDKDYQKMLVKLKDEDDLSEGNISNIHAVARLIFRRAKQQKIILDDPTEYAQKPKDIKTVEDLEKQSIEDKYFEKNELKTFLDIANKNFDHEYYTMFFLLAWTGIRVGELAALKWSDVDFENNSISITKTYFNDRDNTKEFEILTPKTKGSVRVIDIEPEVIAVLKKHKANQNAVKIAIKNEWFDGNFIFGRMKRTKYYGYPPAVKTIEHRFKSVLKKSGIQKKLTPHSLRHTHTSLLAEAGVDLHRIMARLGHTEDKTTRLVYLHITSDRKKEASKLFGDLMRTV
ncbi:tyrosine-type recombinase/integrase [Bacillus altitudinis]|uniref:site-specific integrase n=1 Tax=Bacillus altitudinis TaxID=293387 RepID=UPI0002C02E7B|nr:tyrosine-type recombinase/integrase [Bacillus altitudinis]EMI14714.1 integrase [Bacillus stratosphericus LAMA 585]KJF45828.1 integrase [Bacillus altitudinis]MEC0471215.1 tyrosine-type recombinase/integrase [Bacillus altitudinis]